MKANKWLPDTVRANVPSVRERNHQTPRTEGEERQN